MPRALRFGITLLLVLAAALVVRAKAAIGSDADLQFQLGTLLFDETRYWEALQAFERASDAPDAGLALREQVLKDGKGRDITWVVLTGKTDRQAAQRAFDQGVDDFVHKPVSADIFAAKLRQLIERRASTSGKSSKGVSGSLAEMSLPDMVQILWHGRKTCALRITSGASSGEIDFADGQVVDARWDALRGEDAFYKMLTLREGDFRLDPNFKPPATRSIQASPEALLLEGMRRLDEASL